MLKYLKQYPAAIAGAVQAVLALVVAFGVHLSADQVASVLAVTGALLALVVHTQVTPNSNITPAPPFATGGTLSAGVNKVTNVTGAPEQIVGGPPVIDPSASPPPT